MKLMGCCQYIIPLAFAKTKNKSIFQLVMDYWDPMGAACIFKRSRNGAWWGNERWPE